MEVIVMMLALFGIISIETKDNYEKCKAEEFKPKVCEKYKTLVPPSK